MRFLGGRPKLGKRWSGNFRNPGGRREGCSHMVATSHSVWRRGEVAPPSPWEAGFVKSRREFFQEGNLRGEFLHGEKGGNLASLVNGLFEGLLKFGFSGVDSSEMEKRRELRRSFSRR